jgi:peptidoglycan L-alanyl-D-glutamate endopeptidase CwlK
MSLSKEQQEFTKDVARLIVFAETQEIGLTMGDAYRSEYQQAEYVRTGKSKTMNSKHCNRLAIDFNFFINGKLTYEKKDVEVLGEYWEILDSKNKWGGNWNFVDTPHFQRTV